ncbi:MAG: EAL and GGDEF domain-containing protein [Desulfotomaculum sp.]|nr:EAL and GGDEF domain-containing protein [Desulfotomaculum sp.]
MLSSKFATKISTIINHLPFLSNSPLKGLTSYLQNKQWVGILYLDIVKFSLIEEKFGPDSCATILQQLEITCKNIGVEVVSPYMVIKVYRWGDDICLFFTGDSSPSIAEFQKKAYKFKDEVRSAINEFLARSIKLKGILILNQLDFHVGYAIARSEKSSCNKAVYKALKESFLIAKNKYNLEEVLGLEILKDLITQSNFRIVYQPLVNLSNGEIIGYEALTRGPAGSVLESPGMLFPLAEKAGLLYPLEKVTREKALTEMHRLNQGEMLFLNINPTILNDPSFSSGRTKEILQKTQRMPQHVVFEITERTAITNFSAFRKALEHYRRQGFKVAIDDVGAGYSSLQSVAELKPDFIKIDRSLIANIHLDSTKQALLETFVVFSRKINSALIAEGIETREELKSVIRLGVNTAQGFYIARPANPLPDLNTDFKMSLKEKTTRKQDALNMLPLVGEIVQATLYVNTGDATGDVVAKFQQNKNLHNVVVLDSNEQPVGLITRDKLFYKLGKQYGFDLYCRRAIDLSMDKQPLIIESNIDIDTAAQLAMQRNVDQIYDPFIVIENNRSLGLVSIRQLLDTISNLKMAVARSANPLTGLPGNIVIEAELLKRLDKNIPYAAIYIDLDNFKGFNDRYGFERGDLALKMTGRILTDVTTQYGSKHDLVGHIGGDDFIIISKPSQADTICQKIIDRFAETAPNIYDQEDRAKESITTVDRQGQKVQIPIMSVSIVSAKGGPKYNPVSFEQLAETIAVLKKKAKAIPGNAYVCQ